MLWTQGRERTCKGLAANHSIPPDESILNDGVEQDITLGWQALAIKAGCLLDNLTNCNLSMHFSLRDCNDWLRMLPIPLGCGYITWTTTSTAVGNTALCPFRMFDDMRGHALRLLQGHKAATATKMSKDAERKTERSAEMKRKRRGGRERERERERERQREKERRKDVRKERKKIKETTALQEAFVSYCGREGCWACLRSPPVVQRAL